MGRPVLITNFAGTEIGILGCVGTGTSGLLGRPFGLHKVNTNLCIYFIFFSIRLYVAIVDFDCLNCLSTPMLQ